MRGSDHVVASSVKSKVQVFASRMAPYRFNAALHGMNTKPK
jgi:hypothetical protein